MMLRNTEDPHQPGKGKQENWRSKKKRRRKAEGNK
jgi:hypothetical protein